MAATTTHDLKDVAIIGAGPVGLFSVFACGMMHLSCHLIDALPELGGQCAALYPEKPIYDIPAYSHITGTQLVRNLEKQAAPFRPSILLGHTVQKATRNNHGYWTLETQQGQRLSAKTILIAAGAGSFQPHKPPLKNLAAFEDVSLFYSVRDQKRFLGKHIVIGGGGDSAVDWALALAKTAASVTLVHRRAAFRAAPESVNQLQALAAQGTIKLETPFQLSELKGDLKKKQLTHVLVKSLDGQTEKMLTADCLLAFFGLKAQIGCIADWGLNIEKGLIPINPTTGETCQAGLYAAGDVVTYAYKRKLISAGFTEANQAAFSIRRFLFPDKPALLGHSTTTGLPTL